MAVKTYRLGSGQDGNYGALFEVDQAAASRTDGWTVAKIASTNQSDFDAATKQTSGSFAVSAKPASFLTGTTANAFKTPTALLGTFAATAWTCSFAVRAGTASAQAGRVRLRVFKSKNANGSAATELTGATQVGTTTAALSTSADQTSTVTWNPGATIRLNGEFLFFVIAWEITTAGGSNSSDVLFRTGQAAAGTRVVTPDFVANAQLFGITSLSIIFGKEVAGDLPGYKSMILADGPMFYCKFDGDAKDEVGGGTFSMNAGPTFGEPSLAPGAPGSAVRISSGSFYSGGPVLIDQPFTFEAWIQRLSLTNTWQAIFAQVNGPPAFKITDTGRVALGQGGTHNIVAASINPINDLLPHHIVATKGGSDVHIYIDGVDVTGTVVDMALPSSSYWFSMGGDEWMGDQCNLILDEVAYYRKVLSPEQVLNHYQIGNPPPPPTYYGVTSLDTTFNSTIQAKRKTFGQVAVPITFSKDVRGQRQTFGQVALAINASIVTSGIRLANTFYGQVALPITAMIATAGIKVANTFFGAVSLPIIFSKDVKGQRKTFGQLLSPFLFLKDVRGQRKTFGQVTFPITNTITTAGFRVGLTIYGALSFPVTFIKDVRGQRKAFGQTVFPILFAKDVKGVRKTFGQIVFPIIFIKEAVGRKNVFGQLVMQTIFGKEVAARRKTFSQTSFPLIFTKDVRGQRKTFGKVAFPINTIIVVSGKAIANRFGSLAMPISFGKQVDARRQTFGQTNSPFIFGSASQGQRKAFGQIALLLIFSKVVVGRVGAHGQVKLDLIVTMNTTGNIKLVGIILNDALDLYLGEQNVSAVYIGSEKVWP